MWIWVSLPLSCKHLPLLRTTLGSTKKGGLILTNKFQKTVKLYIVKTRVLKEFKYIHTHTHTHTHVHKEIQIYLLKEGGSETALVVQWLRLCVPTGGVRVWSLVEDQKKKKKKEGVVCYEEIEEYGIKGL